MQRPIDRKPWQPWAFIGDTDAIYLSMAISMIVDVVVPARQIILNMMLKPGKWPISRR